MEIRFYTPRQLFEHLREKETGDADPWWDNWPTLSEQEKLAKDLINQGKLHRSVYLGFAFVDAGGNRHNSGLYGTSCVIPFESISEYKVHSLFDLNGNEVILEAGINVIADGYNVPTYSVDEYVEAYGLKRVTPRINPEMTPGKDIIVPTLSSFPSVELGTPLTRKHDLGEIEPLAELFVITETKNINEMVEQVKKMFNELGVLHDLQKYSGKFKDAYDLLVLGYEGQFGNIAQGTKHDVGDKSKETITNIIKGSHEHLSATDAHFVAKMINEVRDNKK
ncbi:hypothetical protein [Vibrio sp. CAU 1672]|uniref:hypothetical protein n=1 Tax=Vibrio sp. CAU 1672 TaxID=3032594 RepID=UPI0023DA2E12|nr:hypothetical protein [Vibrio sp. CAU 1672]MDF2155302.1 hypothetical protein [Vibrio sp. CAU 1672]